MGRDGARDDSELVADHLGKIDGSARRDETNAPLKDEREIPEDEAGEYGGANNEGGASGAEQLGEAIQKHSEAEDEKRSERNEKTIAEGGDAVPIWIAGDEKIEPEDGGEEWNADFRLAAGEEQKTDERKNEERSPGEEAVVGGEKHLEENWRTPEPIAERNVSRGEGAAIDDLAGDESGEQGSEKDAAEKEMTRGEAAD